MEERQSTRRGPNWNDPFGVVDGADVLWIVWDTDISAPKFRIVRGRHQVGPGLRHGVLTVGDEISGLAFVEGRGVGVAVMDDGETLGIPEPAVPQAHIDMVMSDHVLLHDGRLLRFPQGTDDLSMTKAGYPCSGDKVGTKPAGAAGGATESRTFDGRPGTEAPASERLSR